MHAVTPEKTVQRLLAIQNEIGDGAMKESHEQPEYQIGEIGNHPSRIAICERLPIRRRT